jgi:hypothetical protein
MPKAATALKVFCQNLIHFTCMAHGLQCVVEEVRSNFPDVKNLFHQQQQKVFCKPHNVCNVTETSCLTWSCCLNRWGTWIQAAKFYNEHLDVVKSIVATFHVESAVAVRESQTAFSVPKIACSMSYVHSNFVWIPDIKNLETTGLSLEESIDILLNAEVKLSVRGETGEKVYRKFQAVLKRNPGYSTFMAVCKILNGEDTNSSDDISLGKFHLLKFAPVISCNLERSFSAYKRILSDRQLSMTAENMEKCPWFTVY